jgi:glutamate dehydrogenase (NAD(P)+)
MMQEPRIDRDVVIGGEPFALVVTTYHESRTIARTAVHRQTFQRRIGGARFVPRPEDAGEDYGLAEVGHLSCAMSEKCLVSMIPADGQKSVVVTTPEIVKDEDRKVAILGEHIRIVAAEDPGVIFGPDMSVPEAIQNRLSSSDDLLDHVTGLSNEFGGLAIDHHGYTAAGVVEAILTCVPEARLRRMSATIQGFGAVGAHAARLLHDVGVRVHAVSNEVGMVSGMGAAGLDIPALFAAWQEAGEGMKGNDAVRKFAAANNLNWTDDPDALFAVETDIFIPAARTNVLATPDELEHVRATENKNVQDVVQFFQHTGVRVVAEGANHPLSEQAERWLEQRGVLVLPDYVANCGGLIGCWVEWEARHTDGIPTGAALEALHASALERLRVTIRETVHEMIARRPSLRTIAEEIADGNHGKLASKRISAPLIVG